MSTPTPDSWFFCKACQTNIVQARHFIQELAAHRDDVNRNYLFSDNVFNVDYGRKPESRDPIDFLCGELNAGGVATETILANVHCSICDNRIGWKILGEYSNHPIIHRDQYILAIENNDPCVNDLSAGPPPFT